MVFFTCEKITVAMATLWIMTFAAQKYLSEMVWHFIGVYIINRTLHGYLEIQNFSSCVEKYFVSPCGHVISSVYVEVQFYILSLV